MADYQYWFYSYFPIVLSFLWRRCGVPGAVCCDRCDVYNVACLLELSFLGRLVADVAEGATSNEIEDTIVGEHFEVDEWRLLVLGLPRRDLRTSFVRNISIRCPDMRHGIIWNNSTRVSLAAP